MPSNNSSGSGKEGGSWHDQGSFPRSVLYPVVIRECYVFIASVLPSQFFCHAYWFEDHLEFFLGFFDLVGLDLLAAVEESRKKGWYVETSMPLLWP